MTIEEELALAKTKLAEFEAKGVKTDALESQIKGLNEQLSAMQTANKAKELDLAKREALIEFPGAKDFADLIRGGTPEEIKAAAKAAHERVLERDKKFKETHNIKDEDPLNSWKNVPGSVPPELMIANDRQEQYAKIRASNMPKHQKIVTMMGMKIEDLYKRHVIDVRTRLGIR